MTWSEGGEAAEDGERVVHLDDNGELVEAGILEARGDDELWFVPDDGEPWEIEAVSTWLDYESEYLKTHMPGRRRSDDAGRQPQAERTAQVRIRLRADQLITWRDAAEHGGCSVSEMVRAVVDSHALAVSREIRLAAMQRATEEATERQRVEDRRRAEVEAVRARQPRSRRRIRQVN